MKDDNLADTVKLPRVKWIDDGPLPYPEYHCSCGEITQGFQLCLKCNPQTYKILYGCKPIAQAIADGDTKMDREEKDYCVMCDEMRTQAQARQCKIGGCAMSMYAIHGSKPIKPDAIKALAESVDRKEAIVGKSVSVYEREIWNAAIEAAAICFNENGEGACHDVATEIRKLKK